MPRHHEELLLHGERNLHRPPGEQRERGDQRLELDVELAAEPAAEERHLDPHAVLRPAEQARDLDAHERGILRGGVEREPSAVRVRHGHERLHRRVHHLLGAEGVLEDVRRRREGGVRIAAPELIVERHVGAAPALEMRQVREGRGRLELVVHDHRRRHRLDLVVDRRQLLVFGLDQPDRFLGDPPVGGENHRDRLAGEAHLAVRQDRLVVKGGPVIGMRDDAADVVDRHHGCARRRARARPRRRSA